MVEFVNQHALLSSKQLSRRTDESTATSAKIATKIKVVRNHSFELVASNISTFLVLSNITATFEYSDYDDTFSSLLTSDDCDVVLVWIDLDRYDEGGAQLLIERIKTTMGRINVPVLFAPLCTNAALSESLRRNFDKSILVDIERLQTELGANFFDDRLKAYTGTRCSPQACLHISRLIGCVYLPLHVQQPLKAIVVDLDNTLYNGVLGEDGAEGVELTTGHKSLQEMIAKLASEGLFVCVVSKNEQVDVETLFAKRSDFPLRRESITKVLANWQRKSANIELLEQELNIHHSSMLFIDDNVGELFEVSNALPEISTLWASQDAEANCRALSIFPGVMRRNPVSHEDLARSRDIIANDERKRLRMELSSDEYMRSLAIKIRFEQNEQKDVSRVAELSCKTNQFIFNYKRYNAAKISEYTESPDVTVVTARMSDRLVDSGIVAAAVVVNKGKHLCVEEIVVSCRALGRGLDEVIVLGMIRVAHSTFDPGKEVVVEFRDGPRNGPARAFFEEHLKHLSGVAGKFAYDFPEMPITIEKPAGEPK